MTRQQILDTIKDLSRSQGLYRRIYSYLQKLKVEYPLEYDTYMNHLVNQHFTNPVDLIKHFEC